MNPCGLPNRGLFPSPALSVSIPTGGRAGALACTQLRPSSEKHVKWHLLRMAFTVSHLPYYSPIISPWYFLHSTFLSFSILQLIYFMPPSFNP